MNPKWKEATYSLTDQELKEQLGDFGKPEYTPRFPHILKVLMGKGRPRYSWQVWLANHWPKKLKPVETWSSTRMMAEISADIDEAMIHELIAEIKQNEITKKINESNDNG